jgi:predicted DNA-binding transcriptional regulator YafY
MALNCEKLIAKRETDRAVLPLTAQQRAKATRAARPQAARSTKPPAVDSLGSALGSPSTRSPASKPASGAAGGVTSRVAESASAGETDEAPWQTLTPGELRRRLLDAAAAGESVEILYVNSRDVTQPRTVRPKTVQTRGRAEWLVTHSGASGDAPEFRVDRIVGLR